MTREEIIRRLHRHRAQLEALGVTHAYLFGSAARDAAGPASDIDVMIDVDEGPQGRKRLFSAFDIGGIQIELSRILGRRVDVVVRHDALRQGRKLRPVAEQQLFDVF